MYPQCANIPQRPIDEHNIIYIYVLTMAAMSCPHCQISSKSLLRSSTILPLVNLHGRQRALWKAGQLTLAIEGT